MSDAATAIAAAASDTTPADARGLRILLTDSNRWPVVPRLAIAFRNLGCTVAALCRQPGHPVEKVSGIASVYSYSGYSPLKSLKRAIESFRPDVVLPACDRGVEHLHELHAWAVQQGGAAQSIASLIERSLGSPDGFHIVSSRYELLETALSLGIAVPKTAPICCAADLERWQSVTALPWALKADGTWGGRGVRMAPSSEAAARDYRELTTRASWMDLAQRLILNRDRGWNYLEWNRSRPGIIAQTVIEGRPANCAVVCWQGRVLAGIAVEVIRAQGPQGPATIVRIVPGTEMLDAAEKIARKLGVSGFFGLDFMIESGTERAWLIEMNPRCTPPCPLALRSDSNLVAALWSQLAGRPAPVTEPVTDKQTIAYYPQAGCEPSASDPLLNASYVDIPAGEPALIDALLRSWSSRSMAGRLLDLLRRSRSRAETLPATVFEAALTGAHGKASAAELRVENALSLVALRPE